VNCLADNTQRDLVKIGLQGAVELGELRPQHAYSDDGGQRFRSIADSIPIDGGQDSDASRTAFRRSRTVAPVDTIIGS
jgi:hypothetical protein